MSATVSYEKVTNTLIEALSGGSIPWRKSWVSHAPMNAFTKRSYRGINALVLSVSKYTDPRWATYNQITNAGGNVRKGEKSTTAVFWTFFKTTGKNKAGEDCSTGQTVPYLKYFSVFNVEQCDGLDLKPLADLVARDNTPIEAAEAIVDGYEGKPEVQHGKTGAWYAPKLDMVGMPNTENFDTRESYYSTLFHEFAHSTGAAHRLNRKEVTQSAITFGSCDYSLEELTAEFTAFFLCNAARIENQQLQSNTTAYLQGWITKLNGDIKMAVTAAGRAQKAADYILGIKQETGSEEATAEAVAIA